MSDIAVRKRAFEWLGEQAAQHGDTLPRSVLSAGFAFQGERVPLLGPAGIFKPRICELPLSITTSPNSPYADSFSQQGVLAYRYRGTDPRHRDNQGLREVFKRKLPLVYFFGVIEGRYMATWPAFIVSDSPSQLTFYVQVDDSKLSWESGMDSDGFTGVREPLTDSRRVYLTAQVKVRLHQRAFRERVLRAYQAQCAFCRLKHDELLDAAHIIPDSDPDGEPLITNGVALCKLHHAAFDSHFIGIRPDYVLQVRPDILYEPDGPMHEHGLKNIHNQRLILPPSRRNYPAQMALEKRFNAFLQTT